MLQLYILQFLNDFKGVRVIPEFDMPAHVGYGWQFPGSDNFTVCVGKEPWFNYCLEPPCGQVKHKVILHKVSN